MNRIKGWNKPSTLGNLANNPHTYKVIKHWCFQELFGLVNLFNPGLILKSFWVRSHSNIEAKVFKNP